MKQEVASKIVLGFILVSFAMLIHSTFFDKDLVDALFGISATSIFYYLYRNPKMMMAKSWDEFGELVDNSRDKKFLWGFPAYHVVVLLIILYIWLT
jgi:hypothetical protein